MMSSGRTEHGKQAVAFAVTVSEFTPMMRAKKVGTFEVGRHRHGVRVAKRVLQPGIAVMQRATEVVVALSTVLTAFLLPGVGLYSFAVACGSRLVGELLRCGERGGVDARLELALDEPRVADVDHERDEDDHDRPSGRRS